MRFAAVIAAIPLLIAPPLRAADSATHVQSQRSPTAPPIPRSQPLPAVMLPFVACDRVPQPPSYPAFALARGQQGAVRLRIFVAVTGKISEALVFQSSGSAPLDEAAIASTRTWMLEPGRQGTRPIGMWTEALVSFRILSGTAGTSKVDVEFPGSADIHRCLAQHPPARRNKRSPPSRQPDGVYVGWIPFHTPRLHVAGSLHLDAGTGAARGAERT